MIVLYLVSHVSRLDIPVSLRLIVHFNMSISKIKHSQSENDSLVCCIRLVHVLRLGNPFSLQLIVDFNMSNSEIKYSQSENDSLVCCIRLVHVSRLDNPVYNSLDISICQCLR